MIHEDDRAAVESIDDPLLRDMVAKATADLRLYLTANGIDPKVVNPAGAAYFVVKSLGGPARQQVWRELLAQHAGEHDPDTGFDRVPAALAWARDRVQHQIDKLRGWQKAAAAEGDEKTAARWRSMANYLHRNFVGGEGCTIAAFDARRPQVVAVLDKAAGHG